MAQLVEGFAYQQYVLNAIQAYGHWGAIHPLRVRPERGKAADYGDAYDLMVGSPPGTSIKDSWAYDIDVKARTRAFTDPDSFPFPTIIVEPKARYDKRDTHPDWYAMVSQFNHNILFLPGKTKLSEEIKRGREYVTAPKEKWLTLDQFIKKLPRPKSPSEVVVQSDKKKGKKPAKKKANKTK